MYFCCNDVRLQYLGQWQTMSKTFYQKRLRDAINNSKFITINDKCHNVICKTSGKSMWRQLYNFFCSHYDVSLINKLIWKEKSQRFTKPSCNVFKSSKPIKKKWQSQNVLGPSKSSNKVWRHLYIKLVVCRLASQWWMFWQIQPAKIQFNSTAMMRRQGRTFLSKQEFI